MALVASGQLSSMFYDTSCPVALDIIGSAITAAVRNEPRMGASLVRLHFHDCFVDGCDGSVLLADTGSFVGEQGAAPNTGSIRGMNVIDNAKTQVEAVCKQTVSCADILAVAARDSILALGGPFWIVPLGRRDSTTASKRNAENDLPPPSSDHQGLTDKFSNKGLSVTDMVALSVGLQSLLSKKKGLLHSDQVLFNGGGTDNTVRSFASNPAAFGSAFAMAMVNMGNIAPKTGTRNLGVASAGATHE
ncbi:hypothetical protein ACQ4PT_043828 [Festuca glaucescens]